MLKVVVPTIDNVPRHAALLSNLSAGQRTGLYKELCEKAGQEVGPGLAAFASMSARGQADLLVDLLSAYDTSMSGYISIGVALPIRTSKADTNEKRWSKFAAKVGDEVNAAVRAGYQGVNIIRFEDHGVLVMGFKPPPSALIGSIIPQLLGGEEPTGGEDPEQSSDSGQSLQRHHLVARLVMQGKARVRASFSPEEKREEVRKIVKELTCGSSAEDISGVIEVLDKHVEMHKVHGGCTGKDCELVDYCAILRELLLEHRVMQLC